LQETGVDLPPPARERPRYMGEHGAAEPIRATLFSQFVDDRGADARIYWPTGEHERERYGRVSVRLHQRGGGQHRYRPVAPGKHMHVAPEVAQYGGDRVDVIVEVESPGRERDVARILPIGDVDLVVG